VNSPDRFLNPADAARASGVSTKALRLYEEAGLIAPLRTAAGWRAYGAEQMKRIAEIAALRALGFSLAQVARVLNGNPAGLEHALAAHQTTLEGQLRQIAETVERVRGLRGRLAEGHSPSVSELARLQTPQGEIAAAFDLPWPWGGERFELRGVKPLTYITGPLFSGKTRLAQRLAEMLPNAAFVGLERLKDSVADPALGACVERTLAWLAEDGATPSEALTSLLVRLEAEEPDVLVVDMIEQGLGRGDTARADRASASSRRARSVAVRDDPVLCDLGFGGGRRARDNRLLPGQSQRTDVRCRSARRARL